MSDETIAVCKKLLDVTALREAILMTGAHISHSQTCDMIRDDRLGAAEALGAALGHKPLADYYYFKPSGKWAYEGIGKVIPPTMVTRLTHESIYLLNNGMPGITGKGKDLDIVIIDPTSFPRLIAAVEV